MPRVASKKKNDSIKEVLVKVKKDDTQIKKDAVRSTIRSKKPKKIKSNIIIDIASATSAITDAINTLDSNTITSSSSVINNNNINNNGIKTIKLNGKKNQDIKLINGRGKSVKIKPPSDLTLKDDFPPEIPNDVKANCILPLRENHNLDTLKISNNKIYDLPSLSDYNIKTKQQQQQTNIINDNENNMNNRNNGSYILPMERLVENGYISYYNLNVKDTLYSITNETKDDIYFIMDEEKQKLLYEKQQNPSLLKKRRVKNKKQHDDQQDDDLDDVESTTSRIAIPFGQILSFFGYQLRTGKSELNDTIEEFNKDKEIRKIKFFEDDQLEDDDDEEEIEKEEEYNNQYEEGSDMDIEGYTRPKVKKKKDIIFDQVPVECKMLKQLKEKNYFKYKHRNEINKDISSRVPKFKDEPPLSKEYIKFYRFRPDSTEKLCNNGVNCLMNTCSKEENLCYIGKVFYTPRQMEVRRSKELNLNTEDKEWYDDEHEKNYNGLCIDCILAKFTMLCYQNVAGPKYYNKKEEEEEGEKEFNEYFSKINIPIRQFNHFSVKVEKSEYGEHCMLPVMVNNKPTGIVGKVPMYSSNHRTPVIIRAKEIDEKNNEFKKYISNYLSSTGEDF